MVKRFYKSTENREEKHVFQENSFPIDINL